MLVENETQRLKQLDEKHNQEMKEWKDSLRIRKKVHISSHSIIFLLIYLVPVYSKSALFKILNDL